MKINNIKLNFPKARTLEGAGGGQQHQPKAFKKSITINTIRQILILIFLLYNNNFLFAQIKVDTLYDDKGNIEAYGEVREGKRYGVWYYYFRNGKSYKTINYLDNGEALVKYFSDGDYTNAIELDAMSALPYNISNNQFYLKKYIEGKYNSENYKVVFDGKYYAYFPSGNISSNGQYKKDEFDGVFIRSYKSGQRMNEIAFSEGALNGKWITYYESPAKQVWVEGEYENNAKKGIWKEYFPNGQIKQEGAFNADIEAVYITDENIDSLQILNPDITLEYYQSAKFPLNFKSGVWKYYSEDGKLVKTEYYTKGQLVKIE